MSNTSISSLWSYESRYRSGTRRLRDVEATAAAIRAHAIKIGVTRVGNVTKLDRIGIPVWHAIRPRSKNLTVSQGKGLTDVEASVAAMLESVEMHCAEDPPLDGVSVISEIPHWLFEGTQPLYSRKHAKLDVPFELAPAVTVDTLEPRLVPRDLIHLDFTRTDLTQSWWHPISTGLATGNSAAEAVLHGIYEVIERYAVAQSVHFGTPRISALNHWNSSSLLACIGAVNKAGLNLSVEWLDSPVPEVHCAMARVSEPGALVTFYGSGANLDAEMAASQAVLEAVQSRLTAIVGARDDICDDDYAAQDNWCTLHRSSRIPSRGALFVGRRFDSARDELSALVMRVTRARFRPLVVDLRCCCREIAVVFVLVPGLSLVAGT
jgi:ribosomal protein S12 methylthiotransferase accessory factor